MATIMVECRKSGVPNKGTPLTPHCNTKWQTHSNNTLPNSPLSNFTEKCSIPINTCSFIPPSECVTNEQVTVETNTLDGLLSGWRMENIIMVYDYRTDFSPVRMERTYKFRSKWAAKLSLDQWFALAICQEHYKPKLADLKRDLRHQKRIGVKCPTCQNIMDTLQPNWRESDWFNAK